eukprot:1651588-Prymnesium_polylepis.1
MLVGLGLLGQRPSQLGIRAEQHFGEQDDHLAVVWLFLAAQVRAVSLHANHGAGMHMLGMGAHLGSALAACRRLQLHGEGKVFRLTHIVIPAFAALIGFDGQHPLLLKKVAHWRVRIEADMLLTPLHAEAIYEALLSPPQVLHQERLRRHSRACSAEHLQGAVNQLRCLSCLLEDVAVGILLTIKIVNVE